MLKKGLYKKLINKTWKEREENQCEILRLYVETPNRFSYGSPVKTSVWIQFCRSAWEIEMILQTRRALLGKEDKHSTIEVWVCSFTFVSISLALMWRGIAIVRFSPPQLEMRLSTSIGDAIAAKATLHPPPSTTLPIPVECRANLHLKNTTSRGK